MHYTDDDDDEDDDDDDDDDHGHDHSHDDWLLTFGAGPIANGWLSHDCDAAVHVQNVLLLCVVWDWLIGSAFSKRLSPTGML